MLISLKMSLHQISLPARCSQTTLPKAVQSNKNHMNQSIPQPNEKTHESYTRLPLVPAIRCKASLPAMGWCYCVQALNVQTPAHNALKKSNMLHQMTRKIHSQEEIVQEFLAAYCRLPIRSSYDRSDISDHRKPILICTEKFARTSKPEANTSKLFFEVWVPLFHKHSCAKMCVCVCVCGEIMWTLLRLQAIKDSSHKDMSFFTRSQITQGHSVFMDSQTRHTSGMLTCHCKGTSEKVADGRGGGAGMGALLIAGRGRIHRPQETNYIAVQNGVFVAHLIHPYFHVVCG